MFRSVKSAWKAAKSKSTRYRPTLEQLETRDVPSTTPYLVPTAPNVTFTPIMTVGDTPINSPDYQMVGVPDGLGAFDNGDGTFTLLMNHELLTTEGVARDHGGTGSFVSIYVINKADLSVISGHD